MGALLQVLQVKVARAARSGEGRGALNLGFYLASWGMYRGSGFLLQHTYTIHIAVVDQLVRPEFAELWNTEVGSSPDDQRFVPSIVRLIGP